MYTIDQRSEGNTIGFQTEGKVTTEEAKALLDKIRQTIERHGKANVVWEIKSMDGLSPSAILEDLKFDAKHRKDYDRVAIVGEGKLQEILTKASAPVFGDMKFFQRDDIVKAWAWAKHETE